MIPGRHTPAWWAKQPLRLAYYYGSLPYRWWRNTNDARQGLAPIAILYYHRIADESLNFWTCPTRTFERQILWMRRRFDMISLEEAQRRIRSGSNYRPAVCITFDDGYADNGRTAIPLLVRENIPCTYFVTLANVLEGTAFVHDAGRGQHLRPNTIEELRRYAASGIEIGNHTRTHADLGLVHDPERLHDEVIAAGQELASAIDRPVRYFAFPFGLRENLNTTAFMMLREAGYLGICSAFGGYNFPGDEAFHLHRIHGDPEMLTVKNSVTVDPRKRHASRIAPPFVPEALASMSAV